MSASPLPSRLKGTLETPGRTEKTDPWRMSFLSSHRVSLWILTDLISKSHSSAAAREPFPTFLSTPHLALISGDPARECAF